MKAAGALRATAWVVGVFAVVWLTTIVAWRALGSDPTAMHLVGFLLVLPLAVLSGIWLLRRRGRGPQAVAATGPGVPVDVPAVPSPLSPLRLCASALWLRAGSSPAEVANALVRPERPPLHGHLRDQAGLPVFAAAVDGVDPESMRSVLKAVVAEDADRCFDEERLRAMVLLDPVAEDLLSAAAATLAPAAANDPVPGADRGLHPHAMHHSRSSRAAPHVLDAPTLRVRLLVAHDWPGAARDVAAAWLMAKATAVGLAAGSFTVEVSSAEGAFDAWTLMARLMDPQGRAAPGEHHLLLATHSAIGAGAIARLDGQRELLVSGHPEGRIPGEGAAGVLLTEQQAMNHAPVDAMPIQLSGLRQGPAGQGRGAGRLLGELLVDAMAAAGTTTEAIRLVLTDADHRPSRAIEVAGAMTAALPGLDALEDSFHLGVVCGDLGPAGPLALLAVSASRAIDDGPVLVASVADPRRRTVLAVSPGPAAVDSIKPLPTDAAVPETAAA